MNSMMKHIPVRKNMTGNHEQDAEEESSASEGERETVGKPTGKTPDTQNVHVSSIKYLHMALMAM